MKILAIGALLGFVTAINVKTNEQIHHKQLHRLRKQQNHEFLSWIFGKNEQPAPQVEPKVEPKVESKPETKVAPKAEPKVEPKAEPKAPIAELAKSKASDAQSQAESAASDNASQEESGESTAVSAKQSSSLVPYQLPPTSGSINHNLRKHKLTNDKQIAHKRDNKEHELLWFGHSSTTSSSSTSAQQIRRKKAQQQKNGGSKGWFS